MSKSRLTQKRLKELLRYDAETGIFTRLVAAGNAKAGDIAGNLTSYGYIQIMIDCRSYLSHRLAFLYMTGEFPSDECDHTNHIRNDNRWENIREADRTMNMKNVSMASNNTSGYNGVVWYRGRWYARIYVDSKNIYLGCFIDISDAVAARKAANIKYGYHENHGRPKKEDTKWQNLKSMH